MILNPIKWVRFTRAHRWTQLHMSDYLDGDLDRADLDRAERHIRECPECAGLLASLRNLVTTLAGLRDQPKREVAASVLTGVRERLKGPRDDDQSR